MGWGKRLRQERELRHLSQEALAEALGISARSISRWERDQAIPQAMIRLQLSSFFGLSPGELFSNLETETLSTSIWSIPYQRNPYFTGRENILQQLHTLLTAPQRSTDLCSIALCGLGGLGKTQTAIEYAYRSLQDYHALFWLHAETREQLLMDLLALADRLDLAERRQPDHHQTLDAVCAWLNTHHNWLLILDNVQEVQVIRDLLPSLHHGSLLFTTRLPTLGTLAQTVHLEPMEKDEGIYFLLRRSGQLSLRTTPSAFKAMIASSEYTAVEKLSLAMDGLPLALDQVGAYVKKTQSDLAAFLTLFQRYPLRLLQERDSDEEHPVSLAKTLLLSFEQLKQKCPTATELLITYCMLPVDTLPEELITKTNGHFGNAISTLSIDPLLYEKALQTLLSYALIRRLPGIKSISIHRLVQIVIREQLDFASQQKYALHLLQALNGLFPQWKEDVFLELDTNDWYLCQRLLHLVLACEQFIEHYQAQIPEAIQLFTRVAFYMQVRAYYQQAEELCHRILTLSENLQGVEHLDTGNILAVLVLIYYEQGRYLEAQEFCQRVLVIYEAKKGTEHPDTISIVNVLAELYRIYGKYEVAESLLKRALAFYEQNEAPEAHALIGCLGNLGRLYRDQKRLDEAEPLLRRCLRLCERELGENHASTATASNLFASLLKELGKFSEAESLQKHALNLYEQAFGAEHPYVAIALRNLGQIYFAQHRFYEAEAIYQQCLLLQERILSPEHNDFLDTFTGLGQLYFIKKQYTQAEENLRHALVIAEQTLDPTHPTIAKLLQDLYEVYMSQQRIDEAEVTMKRVVVLCGSEVFSAD
jgi:tetratricopeptide (TPR) repeat protein/transcriptional regulator with XRE-family HTH domain